MVTVSAAGGKLANAFAVKICKMSAAARKNELTPFRLEFPLGVPPVFRRMLNTFLVDL